LCEDFTQELAGRGYYTLFIAEALEVEIKDVLNRPAIRNKFPQITDELVQEMLKTIHEEGQKVQLSEPVEPISRDPKDDIFLACAKAANADYLVSEDNDLLALETHHTTRIVNVPTFLAILEQRRAATPSE
jgi:putative PIN family toxin of toxin-antitoxin system